MKNFYLTIDLEEWYHLLYFRDATNFKGDDFFIYKTKEILNLLDKYNVKSTFFVLAELAQNHPSIIKEIHSKGHEISCHGLNHDLVSNKTLKQFKLELIEAKAIIEDIINDTVLGYRAPCFSISDDSLKELSRLGFKYDSSYIKFSNHRLYGQLKMEGYQYNSDLRLTNTNNFTEFQVPTTKFLSFEVPFSGGGYLRIIPWFLFKMIFKSELDKKNEYQIFLHPFELYSGKFILPIKTGLLSKLRFNINRRKNIYKVEKLIKIAIRKGYSFKTMKEAL
tara:strand:+ start:14861 stop:15694 length:834 start_codon:yes stop_codon:yes gene_type:complete